MGVKLVGLDKLEKDLYKATNFAVVKTVVRKNGSDLQRSMQRKADFVKGYQTGTTKRSIGLAILDEGATAEVGPTTHYAPYLEYGTRYMEAQPFVGPAFREILPNFQRDLKKILPGGGK